jgi:hypothetical protein
VESPVIERVGEERRRMRGLLVGFKYAVVLGAYGGLLWHVNSPATDFESLPPQI